MVPAAAHPADGAGAALDGRDDRIRSPRLDKWWIVLLLLLFALALALPDEQTDRQLGRALRRMPVLFLLTAANLFRLRGTKDKFIHTEHTGAGGNAPGANTPTEP